jgi:hypothetical protein
MIMDYNAFSAHLNALVTEFLDGGGDPSRCAALLRELADEVFEEPMTPERHEAAEHIALLRLGS